MLTPLCLIGISLFMSRSQWPRGLRRRSTAARLLRSWVRIPPRAWMFVCCECCVLSGRGLCEGLITRPEESYRLWRVVVCDQETSRMRKIKPATGLWKIQPQWVVTPGKQTYHFLLTPQLFMPTLSGRQQGRKRGISLVTYRNATTAIAIPLIAQMTGTLTQPALNVYLIWFGPKLHF